MRSLFFRTNFLSNWLPRKCFCSGTKRCKNVENATEKIFSSSLEGDGLGRELGPLLFELLAVDAVELGLGVELLLEELVLDALLEDLGLEAFEHLLDGAVLGFHLHA